MGADLTPYVPRVVLDWDDAHGSERHAAIEGTLVFADVSGFTRLSERLALAGGRLGAEQLAEVINGLFDELLTVAVRRGGEMLKYGGDAVLLFFRGDDHPTRAAAASVEMQRRLRDIGRVETGAGIVRMRMSVGVHTGTFDMFLVGRAHRELVIGGPGTTRTIQIEAAAAATEVLVSDVTSAALGPRVLGPVRAGARLVRRAPAAPELAPVLRSADERAGDFIPTQLREHLLAGAVEAEHRLVTQAFVHVSGLDGLLADRGGPVAAEALEGTMVVVQEACARYGVTFLASDIAPDGVKLILVAGAPLAVEEPEARMVAALETVRAADCPLPVRAGVHCGHVFTGDVGPMFRRTYTTIGDVTNTAARVMGHARPGEVLALRDIADALGASYVFEELPPFTAKGKVDRLVPYRLGGPRADVHGADADDPGRSTMPFTGRDHELETLVGLVGSARERSGTVVEVLGDVGVGKTRIVNEVVDRVGMPLRRLSCEPYESTTPYFVIGHLVRAVLGRETGATVVELEHVLASRCPELLAWSPLIAETLDLPAEETPETAALDPRFRRQRTARVVVDLLGALLNEPTVLVFEDVQWVDEPSSDVLDQLEADADARPWSIVLTRRQQGGGHRALGGVATTVVLEPLDPLSATALVEAACVGHPLPAHRVQQIVERGAGNPLFIEGLLRMGSLDDGALPDSIEAVVATEIDGLASTARRLLRLAAVHGHSFELAHLVATAREDGIGVPLASAAAVSRFVGGSLVAEGRGRLRFRHHVLRDVAYGGLPFRERGRFHGHAADVLLRDIGEAVDDRVGLLSRHEWHAGRYASCWEHSRLAGVRAAGKHAHVEAAAAFQRAIDAAAKLDDHVVPREALADVWERLGDAAAMTGDRAAASLHFKRARRHAEAPAVLARLCGKEARLAEVAGGRPRARRWLRRGLEVIDGCLDEGAGAVRASLLARQAWTAEVDGRYALALALSERAVAEGLEHGNHEATGHAYVVMDSALHELGRGAEADHRDEALSLFDAAGAIAAKAGALNNLGVRAYYRGAWADARTLYDAARAANLAAGNVADAGFQTYNMAEIRIDQGHFDDAEALLDELDGLWRSIRFDVGVVFAAGLRGVLELRRRRIGRASALLGDARRRLHDSGLHIQAVGFDLAAAEAFILDNDGRSASLAMAEVRQGSRSSAVPGADAHLARLDGVLAALAGDHVQAAGAIASGIRLARASDALFQVLLGVVDLRALGALGDLAWLDAGGGPSMETELERLADRLGITRLPPPLISGSADPPGTGMTPTHPGGVSLGQ